MSSGKWKNPSRVARQPRRSSTENAHRLYNLICSNPAIHFRDLCKLIGASGGMQSRLAALEAHGLLVYEDEYGHLYPFR